MGPVAKWLRQLAHNEMIWGFKSLPAHHLFSPLENYFIMNYYELGANFFYVVSTVYASRNKVHTWWTGIISCLLFCITFYHVKLYADVSLQFFYIATCVYGWKIWQQKQGSSPEKQITKINPLHFICYLALSIIVSVGYGYALWKLTDAANPFIDSFILALSVLGQFLLMQRKIENWYVWFVVDAIAIPLYFYKGLHLTALLYASLLIIAIYGFIYWKKEMGNYHRQLTQKA